MPVLDYHDRELYLEATPLKRIADEFGTPCYIYSKQQLLDNWRAYYNALQQSTLPFKIYYAVKANSNLQILRLLAEQGAGFDVVSGGEIARVMAAGGKPHDIVFAGVGKSDAEINYAIDLGLHSLHVESAAELQRIQDLALKKNKTVGIALRINPDVETGTHHYISTGSYDNKFGIDYTKALDMYALAKSMSNIRIKGIACHIGSQITTMAPFLNAIDQLLNIISQLQAQGIDLEYIDVGGGLGICYKDEVPPTPKEYIQAISQKLKDSKLTIHIEPGRSIVANAGFLLTKVQYLKTTGAKHFAIVDAAMNDLIRPALYDSYHGIEPVMLSDLHKQNFSVVGPVCESGDFLALDRELSIKTDDLIVIKDCGAYGFSMSSNYNTRPRCAEVLVDGSNLQLIRKRETIEQLLENELACA